MDLHRDQVVQPSSRLKVSKIPIDLGFYDTNGPYVRPFIPK